MSREMNVTILCSYVLVDGSRAVLVFPSVFLILSLPHLLVFLILSLPHRLIIFNIC